MKKTKETLLIMILVSLAIIIIVGCSNAGNPTDNAGRQRRPGNFSQRGPGGVMANLTDEQRQQMMEQRIQTETAACQSKSVNDTCVLSNPRGNMTGTCRLQQENLLCMTQRGAWPQNRTFTR